MVVLVVQEETSSSSSESEDETHTVTQATNGANNSNNKHEEEVEVEQETSSSSPLKKKRKQQRAANESSFWKRQRENLKACVDCKYESASLGCCQNKCTACCMKTITMRKKSSHLDPFKYHGCEFHEKVDPMLLRWFEGAHQRHELVRPRLKLQDEARSTIIKSTGFDFVGDSITLSCFSDLTQTEGFRQWHERNKTTNRRGFLLQDTIPAHNFEEPPRAQRMQAFLKKHDLVSK